MNEKSFFFDTYALIELIRGNPKYEQYSYCKIITTIFNLAEFNYSLKKEMTKEKADSLTYDYKDFVVEINLKDIIKAMDLKSKNRDFSIPDVVGYIMAEKHGVKFLTGDEDFNGLDNVEFVKK